MLYEAGKAPLVQWNQLIAFVIGILFSYLITIIYRKRYVPQEYHKAFSFAITISYIFILFVSWGLNFIIMSFLEYDVVASFIDLIILITLLSIFVGNLGVFLVKAKKKISSRKESSRSLWPLIIFWIILAIAFWIIYYIGKMSNSA
ncbi:MAG: hypothetical protein WC317_07275 [Candidatus Omnitrophota bacterium]|jgi:H+/Cl- antiporter ClcA